MSRRSDGEKAGCSAGTASWLTTGEMARLCQTTLRTVRFYEAEGLIASRARNDGKHRMFASTELEKLLLIADFRDAGLSLHEIKALIALKGGCRSARQAAEQMSSALCAQARALDQRIAALQRVRGELSSMLEMLRTCRECESPAFPKDCAGCEQTEKFAQKRGAHLLWKN